MLLTLTRFGLLGPSHNSVMLCCRCGEADIPPITAAAAAVVPSAAPLITPMALRPAHRNQSRQSTFQCLWRSPCCW